SGAARVVRRDDDVPRGRARRPGGRRRVRHRVPAEPPRPAGVVTPLTAMRVRPMVVQSQQQRTERRAANMHSLLLADKNVRTPAHFPNLEAYRAWAKSDAYPESGRFAYLAGDFYVDFSMEQAFSHNQVKGEYAIVLGRLSKLEDRGYYFHDRMLL